MPTPSACPMKDARHLDQDRFQALEICGQVVSSSVGLLPVARVLVQRHCFEPHHMQRGVGRSL